MGNDTLPQRTGDVGNTRRKFLKWLIGFFAILNGLVLGIPLLRSLIGSGRAKKLQWSRVADIGSLLEGKPIDIRFRAISEEAYFTETKLYSVWVIKHSPAEATVFSPICPHLGCRYQWNRKTGHFECPCHASVFSIDGKVIAGPAPRPLDTLPFKIENNVLFVEWEQFKTGTPEKIEVQE